MYKNKEAIKLKHLAKSSNCILITSHISPDPDAVASVLLAGTTLRTNFPDKKVHMVIEEKSTKDLSFLAGYSEIQFIPLAKAIEDLKPDLLIIVDAMNFERCSRFDGESIRSSLKQIGTKVVVIDHHEEIDVEPAALYFNKKNPATSQELYELLFYELGLKKPEDYAQTTLLGIISDSARFKYDNPRHRETFKVVSELLDSGVSIEQLENITERYSAAQMKAIATLASSIKNGGQGYTFAYLDESILDSSMSRDEQMNTMKAAVELFTNQFARNFENNSWGFIVYPELASGPNVYSVSFRSVTGGIDVAALAHKLGGGGHKQAAGAKIQASSAKEALRFVQSAINDSGLVK